MACCGSKKSTILAVLPPAMEISSGTSVRDIVGGEVMDLHQAWDALCSAIVPPSNNDKLPGSHKEKLLMLKDQLTAAVTQRLMSTGETISMQAVEHYDEVLKQVDSRLLVYGIPRDAKAGEGSKGVGSLLKEGLRTFNKKAEDMALVKQDPDDADNPIMLDQHLIKNHSTGVVVPLTCFEIALRQWLTPFVNRLASSYFENRPVSKDKMAVRNGVRSDYINLLVVAMCAGKTLDWLANDKRESLPEWRGVEYGMDSRVRKIYWKKMKLGNQLSSNLLNLEWLTYLNLSYNNFTGRIDVLFKCTSLEHLDISHNQFSGELEIVPDMGLTDMEKPKLMNGGVKNAFGTFFGGGKTDKPNSRQSLRKRMSARRKDSAEEGGSDEFDGDELDLITPNLGDCTKLKYLDVSHNKFDGYLPEKFYDCHDLEYFDVSFNRCNGVCPDITLMGKLWYCNFDNTRLQLPPKYKKNGRAEMKDKKDVLAFQASFTKHFSKHVRCEV
jgi:hypothetical protein